MIKHKCNKHGFNLKIKDYFYYCLIQLSNQKAERFSERKGY